MNNRGISRIVEFVIMFTVFLIIVATFYSLVNIWTRPPIVNYNQEEAMRVSEVLIGNPGCLDNNNSKTNWELYPAYYKEDAPDIDTNMTSLGFAKDKNSYGVLSMSKILGMGKITYSKARILLGLSTGKNFNISFQIIGNETKICWGADYTNAKNVGMYKRIVAVYNPINNNYTSAKLTVRLFDGGKINEKIVINEIMYDPPTPPLTDEENEWVELYNPTNMAINVSGWIIGHYGDVSTMKWAKLTDWNDADGVWGTILPSNQFAIIPSGYHKKSVKENYTYNPDAIWLEQRNLTTGNRMNKIADRSLNNGEDTLTLKNRYHEIIDNVEYVSSLGGDGNGETIERLNPWISTWAQSQTKSKNGTLGRRNSISDFSNPSLGNLISIGPDRCNISCVAGKNASFNITVMNNGNINDTITISNVSGWNVNIIYLSGGTNYTKHANGTIEANLSAINLSNYVNETYLRLEVNVTIPATASHSAQNIAIIIAKSSKYSIVFDTATLLTKIKVS